MRARRSLLGAVALFALLITALLFESLVGGKILSANDQLYFAPPLAAERPPELTKPSNPALADAVHFMHPDLFAAREAVRGGDLPLWNPYIQGGRPLLASQQAGPLYPLNAPAYVLPFWDSLAWLAALKLMFGAVGMFLFCRGLGIGFAGAALGGVAFAFGAQFVVWLEHPEAQVYAATPWMLLFADRLARRGGLSNALALAAALAIGVLGGHPESFFVAGVGVVALVLWRLWAERRHDARVAGRRLALFGVSLALGAAGAGILVVPFFELLGASVDVSREGPPDSPRVLYGLFFPEMWGRGDKIEFEGAPVFGYVGHALYFGALPLLLAVGGLVGGWRKEQSFFLAVAGGALLLMLDIPIWESIVRGLPVLSLMYLHFFVLLVVIAGAVLAAFGLERFLHADHAERRRILLVMAAAAVVPMLYLLRHLDLLDTLPDALAELPTLGENPPSQDVAALASVLRFGIAAAIGLALVVAAARGLVQPRYLAVAAVAFTALDLVSLNRGFHPAIDPALANPPTPPVVRTMQEGQDHARVAATGRALAPNTTAYYELLDLRGEGLPRIERYSRLYATLDGILDENTGRYLYAPNGRSEDLLDLFAVRFLLDPEGRGVNELASRPSALPRAYLASDWVPARDVDEALALTAARDPESLRRQPVVEGIDAPPAPGPRSAPGAAEVIASEPDRVEVAVRPRGDTVLVLADTYYPGWDAEVDGKPATIHAANTAFRAVEIPAGSRRVTFDYDPTSVKAGAALSGVALSIIGIGLLAAWRRRRQTSRAT